jgi:lysine 2,3-aminomutase
VGQEQKGSLHTASVIFRQTTSVEEGKILTLPFISKIGNILEKTESEYLSNEPAENVARLYPVRISPFYANLIDRENPHCPIRLQACPSPEELREGGVADPLGETSIQMTPAFFMRYPKRGVFLVSGECAMYCRFCNRKRLVGREFRPQDFVEETLTYIDGNKELREIIVSGGDPLVLPPPDLRYVLERLKRMDHIKTIRVSTRVPVVCPELLDQHRETIKEHGPLWIVIHINHPREITPEFLRAVGHLHEARAHIVSQTVLLRGINDCHHILGKLFQTLVEAGVKPYYLFQLDDVHGAAHFKVRLEKGISIMRELRKSFTGIAIPQYALDITGGLGKVPLEGGYVRGREGDRVIMENLYGQLGSYLDNGQESRCLRCNICRS